MATQSSTELQTNVSASGPASLAIDGNRNGDWYLGSITHTGHEIAWWQVQLDNSYQISQINIFNRTDCCSDRLIPFKLSLLDGANLIDSTDVNSFVSDITDTNITGMTFNFNGQIGDTVRVDLLSQNWLSLAEVEVYGSPVPVPNAVWLFGTGLFGLLGLKRSKQ